MSYQNTFEALRVYSSDGKIDPRVEHLSLEQLSQGEVVIAVQYSSINYKDALAVTGKGKILRRFPLIAGIDAAGIIIKSSNGNFTPGQSVLVTGCGIGENDDGGFSQVLRVKASSVVPLPNGLTLRECMILGTAGFTAALALHRMEQNGQRPALGPILITGSSGGVGSFAIQIFSQAGYEVHALTAKLAQREEMLSWGAAKVLSYEDFNELVGTKPLETMRFGGAIDNVGGKTLSRLLATTQLWGNVASIGLADSFELHSSVMPFILRGVSLLGVSSNNAPKETRLQLWQKLAGPWKPRHLEAVLTKTVRLNEVVSRSHELIERKARGRTLVKLFYS